MRTFDIPTIPGDPDGMRAAATAIDRHVAELDRLRATITSKTSAMRFQSKHGRRTKSEVSELGKQAAAQCAILTGLSSNIRIRAKAVETAQRERLATISRLRREESERMRAANGGS